MSIDFNKHVDTLSFALYLTYTLMSNRRNLCFLNVDKEITIQVHVINLWHIIAFDVDVLKQNLNALTYIKSSTFMFFGVKYLPVSIHTNYVKYLTVSSHTNYVKYLTVSIHTNYVKYLTVSSHTNYVKYLPVSSHTNYVKYLPVSSHTTMSNI